MKVLVLSGAGVSHGITAIGTASGRWVLVNVSARVAEQLGRGAEGPLPGGPGSLHPGLRDADVRALVLTDAQIEHVGGLLALRGGAPIDLYATPSVFEALTTGLPVLPVLQHYCGVHWRVVPVAGDQAVAQFAVEGLPELAFTAIATRAPLPPHARDGRPQAVGDSIALAVEDRATGQRVFCAPGLAHAGAHEIAWMRQADCLLVDAQAEADDARHPRCIDLLGTLPARRKVVFGTPPSQPAPGVELAYAGMEIDP